MNQPSFQELLAGCLALAVAVSVITGKTLGMRGGPFIVSRATKPRWFWVTVGAYALMSLFFWAQSGR